MAQEAIALPAQPQALHFANGTTVHGLAGHGELRQQRSTPGLRSLPADIDTSPEFDRALRLAGIAVQETLQLQATRLQAGAADEIEIAPARAPGDLAPRVVLYQDESGGLSWHFATAPRPGLRAAAAPGIRVPLRTAAARQALGAGMPRRNLRGPITKLGRKLFKVLVLPVASALLQDPVRWLAENIENRARPARVWRVTPDNYRNSSAEPFADWDALRGGPVLLLIHGIFSSVSGMLNGLPREAMQRWHERYQGRVIAYDHPTVSVSPQDNAAHFLRMLFDAKPVAPLELHIVCHSRGGIVARSLTERAGALIDHDVCHISGVYFAGTPNAGSPLGDADHMIDMLDLFTNCLTSLPDGTVAYSIEVLLGLVALAGHSAAKGLPGIASLGTRQSYIVDTLNRATDKAPAFYAAAAADYEPQLGRDNGWLIDRLGNGVMDRVFERNGRPVANDLVVPQQGVFAANGHPSFPIPDPLVYGAADGVWHTAFFSQPRTLDHIDDFFDRLRLLPCQSAPVAMGDSVQPRRGGLRGPRAPGQERLETPASAPSSDSNHVERDPEISFPQSVEAGRTVALYVALNPPARQASSGRLSLSFEPGSAEVELTAEVSAPGFRIDGERCRRLIVKRERDPNTEFTTFALTALDAGAAPVERQVDVSFWRGNECVGGVRQSTRVVPRGHASGGATPPTRSNPLRLLASRRREQADLVLCVRQPEAGRSRFDLEVRSVVEGDEYESRPFGSFDLDGRELSQYLSDAVDRRFADFPGEALDDAAFERELAAWNRRFITTLGDLGDQLWLHLPQAFRTEYMRLAALPVPPRSLFVFSDELSFPWEIVRPSGRVDGQWTRLPPLGTAHVMGRWRPGIGARPQPQALLVRHAALVIPDAQAAGLPWALAELEELRGLLPQAASWQPATRANLDRLLSQDDVQLVHFSGHGDTGPNADLSSLQIEGGESIPAMAFAATGLGDRAQPVLYLNACSVGRAGRVLARAGGFAGNCIEAGWSGVIAPYWPVFDADAAAFSVAFYARLLTGCTIGEALQELRAERPDDPTAQSYAYFGDPFARLMFAGG
ncbi:hypothetical protein ASC95_14310 [Pelomonas sp. Root1217]|uniref:DUF7379 domain-containing protein n=1 Tax=unclassified Roseateles TaxID=2626991 RepID=UPI0006FCE799|nr:MULTISPECIES: CHAT domain-containing protein [unclassified Roseateles]KQV50535.1 hypothetical protein ASC95_14310 [Pelomonas sp. Root1217]KQV88202.1 hypothetical protein ASC91_15380 [Pelomonas sp. Root1237]